MCFDDGMSIGDGDHKVIVMEFSLCEGCEEFGMWCVGVLACGSVDGEGSSLCGAAGDKAFVAAMLDSEEERISVLIGCF